MCVCVSLRIIQHGMLRSQVHMCHCIGNITKILLSVLRIKDNYFALKSTTLSESVEQCADMSFIFYSRHILPCKHLTNWCFNSMPVVKERIKFLCQVNLLCNCVLGDILVIIWCFLSSLHNILHFLRFTHWHSLICYLFRYYI